MEGWKRNRPPYFYSFPRKFGDFFETLRWKLDLKATAFHGKLYNDKAESLY